MRKIIFMGFFLAATASAQLLGTTGSFAESAFCKQYGCTLMAKDPIGAGVTEYTYTVGREPENYNPYKDGNPFLIFVVRRLNNKVISGYFGFSAQDSVFAEDSKQLALYTGFITQLTGAKPSLKQMSKIEDGCGLGGKGGQAVITPWNHSYAIGCVNYGYLNARQFRYNIFKP